VEYYERQVGEYKAALDSRTEEAKEERKPTRMRWKIFAALTAGLLAGIVITFKIKKRNGK